MLNTIGYEGAKLSDFLRTLKEVKVDILIDIRERAQSRRAGFSKSALQEALSDEGIDYVHLRQLGDPKPGREAARAGDYEKFRRIFADVMASSDAEEAIHLVAQEAGKRTVCLLCYERDPKECHRQIVAKHLESTFGFQVRHLGVRSYEPFVEQTGRMRHTCEGTTA